MDRANALLGTDELRAHGILRKFRVKAVCTTDDPTDDLAPHKAIAASSLETKVFPAFRPDKALNVHLPEMFNAWVARLEAASNSSIGSWPIFWTRSAGGTISFTRWAGASPITA